MPARKGILLINPYIHDFSAYNLWLRPLGLIGLYGFLSAGGIKASYADVLFPTSDEAEKYGLVWPESGKYHTGKFPGARIDKPLPYKNIPRYYRRFGIPPPVLKERLEGIPAPGCVLMTSGMTYWYPGVRETIRICREAYPGVPVILGGVYATLCASHARRYSGADMVLPGPWQKVLPEFLRVRFGIEPGPAAGCSGEFGFSEAELYPDSGFGVIRLGEGCPFNCGYCASGLLSGSFMKYPAEHVYEGILRKVAGGCEDIAFYDDALLAGAEDSLIPLLERISASGLKCRFHTPNGLHARYMTGRIAGLFRACDFRTVRLSFDRAGRDSPGAKASAEHLAGAARALEKAGYSREEIEVYTLIGLSGQTDDDIMETYRIIGDTGMKIAPAYYSPVPGTAFFERDCRRAPELGDEPLLHNSSVAAMWDYDIGRYDRLKRTAGGV